MYSGRKLSKESIRKEWVLMTMEWKWMDWIKDSGWMILPYTNNSALVWEKHHKRVEEQLKWKAEKILREKLKKKKNNIL